MPRIDSMPIFAGPVLKCSLNPVSTGALPMMSRILLFGALLLGVAFAGLVPIPGTQRVGPIFESADLVCNCYVESLRTLKEQKLERAGKPFTQRYLVAKLRVNDPYNKEVQIGTEINVAFEEEIPTTESMPTLSEAETALMFLKLSSPSLYEFADRFMGATPFAFLPVQNKALGLSKLQSALAAVLQLDNRDDQINAMRLLGGFDELSPETLTIMGGFTDSADPETALSAIAVLLKAKQPGSVLMLESYLRIHKPVPVPVAVLTIGGELGQVSDIEELTPLEALTSSELLSIKLGALAGVRKIRSPLSAKALVKRLDDPNADVRFLAVITLSEIFSKSGDYAPNMYQFDHNPEFYTIKWKTWWVEQGPAIQ